MEGTFSGFNVNRGLAFDEACKAFGLDRKVEKRPLFYPGSKLNPETGEPELLVSPWHCQTVDVATDNPLGVVGDRYTVVPYPVAFSSAEALIAAGAEIIGGGAPNKGEVGYLILEAPGTFKVGTHEVVNRFFMRSSHDGSGKIEIRTTPYFTGNHIAMTVDASRPLSFKHTLKVNSRIQQAAKILKRVNANWDEVKDSLKKMIGCHMSAEDSRLFIQAITPSQTESKRIENIREDIFILFTKTGRARVMPQCQGTLFGLVQAVGEWADLHRTTRKSDKRDKKAALIDARLISDAAKRKQKAWAMSLWLLKKGKGALKGASFSGSR